MQSPSKTIVFASPVSDFRGGAERSMFELIINTKSHGYRPVVILPRKGEIEKKLKDNGIKTYLINYDWWARNANDKRNGFPEHRATNGEAVIKITQVLEKEKPFICMSYTAVFPWLAYAAAITNTPHIWQVCEILSDSSQWRLRIPLQSTMSVIDGMSVKVFANSTACKRELIPHLPSHNESVEVVYPYVDQQAVLQASNEPIASDLPVDQPLVCIVGNIQPSKGQLDAVLAISRLKAAGFDDVLLLLVGSELDKAYVKKIRATIKQHSLEGNVLFIGYTANPYAYVKRSDVALVCSPHEAFGRVTIEAMTIGTPVIGVDSDGTSEIIGHSGKFGLLYPSGNSKVLYEKVRFLLDNKEARDAISKDAKKYVAKNFTRDRNQRPFFDCLEMHADKPPRGLMPFSDISIAYRDAIAKKQQELELLQNMNLKLATQLEEITSSKKWRLVTKIGEYMAFVRSLSFYLKLKLKQFFKYYLRTSYFRPKQIFSNEKQGEVAIIICLWQRFDRIPDILEQLDKQYINKNINVYFWNNNYKAKSAFSSEITSFKPVNSISNIFLYNSVVNIGGFGRFYLARKLSASFDRVIFLDDDQNIGKYFIDDCQKAYKKEQIASFWSFGINGDEYWNRHRVKYGQSADYCGTGGMVVDSSIFQDKALFNCPSEYWFLEDTWLSFFAKAKGWELTGLDTNIEFVMADKDQGHAIFDLKTKFYKYLKSDHTLN